MIEFTLPPLKESDLPRLFEWLAIPHVAHWWRESRDWDTFSKKYQERIVDPTIGQFIVMHNNKPIGFISWYDAQSDPIRKKEFPASTYGFDLFIADMDYIGRGYGPKLIKQFIDQEIMPMNPVKIIADPEVSNVRAIRAYEKAGFKKAFISQGTDGTKPVTAQVMEKIIS